MTIAQPDIPQERRYLSAHGVTYIDVDANFTLPSTTFKEHTLLFMVQGVMEANLQGEPIKLTRGIIMDFLDGTQGFGIMSMSDETRAVLLIITNEYIHSLFLNHPPCSVNYISAIKRDPTLKIDDSYIPKTQQCLNAVKTVLEDRDNRYRDEILRCHIRVLFMEITNIFEKKLQSVVKDEFSSPKNDLFFSFIRLVPAYIRTNHKVGFYASLLCVSPQYLRSVVKGFSGKTVSQWINEELIREINKSLTQSNMSIEKIAEKLGFSDQAVLTKFFKRQTGMTPLHYRNYHKPNT